MPGADPFAPSPLQSPARTPTRTGERDEHGMDLGAFSISLVVKDLEASTSFHERLGVRVFAGDARGAG